VVKSIKHNVESLARSLNVPRQLPLAASRAQGGAIIEEVRDMVLGLNGMSGDDKSNALQVLDKLSHEVNSSIDASEVDVLRLVWGTVRRARDARLAANLRETLAKQLASAVERGHVVCSTGRLARIMATLDGVEDAGVESVRPLWAVKDEIATLAAKVREDVLAARPEPDRRAYEAGSHIEIEEAMKAELGRRARQTYCKDLGMSEAVVAPLIEQYAAAF
jgi:hypothetical protein